MEESFENHFLEQGKGETLILLHGNGEESSYFEKQIEEFSTYYRVIAIDTRGHGKTPEAELHLPFVSLHRI